LRYAKALIVLVALMGGDTADVTERIRHGDPLAVVSKALCRRGLENTLNDNVVVEALDKCAASCRAMGDAAHRRL
jgi:hypothetical protein